jgi:hypothetical protein
MLGLATQPTCQAYRLVPALLRGNAYREPKCLYGFPTEDRGNQNVSIASFPRSCVGTHTENPSACMGSHRRPWEPERLYRLVPTLLCGNAYREPKCLYGFPQKTVGARTSLSPRSHAPAWERIPRTQVPVWVPTEDRGNQNVSIGLLSGLPPFQRAFQDQRHDGQPGQ